MTRWGHGHSLAAGVIGGLLLADHAFVIAAAALVLGIVLGRFWAGISHGARIAASHAEAKLRTEHARRLELVGRAWNRHRTRDEQDRELKRSYIQGATDQLHTRGVSSDERRDPAAARAGRAPAGAPPCRPRDREGRAGLR